MARRSTTEEQSEPTKSNEHDLAASVARLTEATTLLLSVAERLDRKMDTLAPPAAASPEPPIPRKARRKKAEPPEQPTEPDAAQAVQAAIGSVIDVGKDGDTTRVQMNAPSDEVFGRFFGKVLELYEINLKRVAEERDRRFHSGNREETLKEIQATIEMVFFSPLITNAEKNEALRILIKQIVPYEDRIEITYW